MFITIKRRMLGSYLGVSGARGICCYLQLIKDFANFAESIIKANKTYQDNEKDCV